MIEVKINPNVGIGKIKLGMIREEVHKIMGNCCRSFKRGEANIDSYYSECLQINYDEYNKVNFIELARDIVFHFNVLFQDANVFETKAEELVQHIEKFASYDRDDFESNSGHSFIFRDIGISLWRPNVYRDEMLEEDWFKELSQEEKDEEMKYMFFESVGLAVKGYWD